MLAPCRQLALVVLAATVIVDSSVFAEHPDGAEGWWSFQPVKLPEVPQLSDDSWARGPIDRFILQRLRSEGLAPGASADRRTLLRRATYDLTGLPPTSTETAEFLADSSPDAYERLIERLLASPRYGEHWGRYWLDLVRYAESDGYKQDDFRPAAHLYRDYVIDSLNADKPYDRFVREQLAGDEIFPDDRQALIATMFLRHGIYEYNNRDVETQWADILDEITDVTGDVFLGLGLSCARCHDHKFDPISQHDYYRIRAFFTPLAFREDLPVANAEVLAAHSRKQQEWEAKTAALRRQLRELEFPVLLEHSGAEGFQKMPPAVKEMILLPPENRTLYQEQIAQLASRQFTLDPAKLPDWIPGAEQTRWRRLREQLQRFDSLKPDPLPTQAFVVSDVAATAPPTNIPGEAQRASGRSGDSIEPGFLSAIDARQPEITPTQNGRQSTGRRTALATWIANADNPLTARVIVNRVWQAHFGRGLAATTSDLGQLGESPTHPKLLDWLAAEFVANGWRLKSLHRKIMTSASYRQSAVAQRPPAAMAKDPRNTLLWRRDPRRLRAEEIRDSVLAATGELDLTPGGASDDHDSYRRAVYLKSMRNSATQLLASFDVTDCQSSVAKRNVTTTPMQALLVVNSRWMWQRGNALAERVARMSSDNPAEQISTAYHLTYGRAPNADEASDALELLRASTGNLDDASSETEDAESAAKSGQRPLGDLCHALLCSNEFFYVD